MGAFVKVMAKRRDYIFWLGTPDEGKCKSNGFI